MRTAAATAATAATAITRLKGEEKMVALLARDKDLAEYRIGYEPVVSHKVAVHILYAALHEIVRDISSQFPEYNCSAAQAALEKCYLTR